MNKKKVILGVGITLGVLSILIIAKKKGWFSKKSNQGKKIDDSLDVDTSQDVDYEEVYDDISKPYSGDNASNQSSSNNDFGSLSGIPTSTITSTLRPTSQKANMGRIIFISNDMLNSKNKLIGIYFAHKKQPFKGGIKTGDTVRISDTDFNGQYIVRSILTNTNYVTRITISVPRTKVKATKLLPDDRFIGRGTIS